MHIFFLNVIIFLFYSTEEDLVQGAAAPVTRTPENVPTESESDSELITRFDENQLPPIDIGSDALQNEMSASLINQMLRSSNTDR